MFHPKVSIIIPVYNGSDFVGEAIDSALSQDYDNIEIIVINDGSNDRGATDRVVEGYGDKVIYIKKENGGVATALNLGIETMTGEYFSWLSHDDLYMSDKISKQIQQLSQIKNKKDIILFSNYVFINETGKEINKIEIHYPPEKLLYKLLINSFLNGCTLLIPRGAFSSIGVFEHELQTTQDYHLWFRMMKKFTFINTPYYLVKSRQHSGQDSKKKLFIAMKERKFLENYIFSKFSPEELKESAGSNLPNLLFIWITKCKLEKYRILGFLYFIAQKLHIDIFLATIYRKIFKY